MGQVQLIILIIEYRRKCYLKLPSAQGLTAISPRMVEIAAGKWAIMT